MDSTTRSPNRYLPAETQDGTSRQTPNETRQLILSGFPTPTETRIARRFSGLVLNEKPVQSQHGTNMQFQHNPLSASEGSQISNSFPSFDDTSMQQRSLDDPFVRAEILGDPIIQGEVLALWAKCLQDIETDEDAANQFERCVASAESNDYQPLKLMVFQWLQTIKTAVQKKLEVEMNEGLVWTVLENNGANTVTWKEFLIGHPDTMGLLLRCFLVDLGRHLNAEDPEIQAKVKTLWLGHIMSFVLGPDVQTCLADAEAGNYTMLRDMAMYWIERITREVARDCLETRLTEKEVWDILVAKKQLKGSWKKFRNEEIKELTGLIAGMML